MVEQTCTFCGEQSPDAKRCAGCKKVWYCSTRCQKDHWTWHIFDCKTTQPISSVHYLVRAIYEDVVPVDAQARIDYGFDKAERMIGGDAGNKLVGLYTGLIKYFGITAKELRQWQREGRLIERIKATYEKQPPGCRGGYYPWFLQHQYILDGKPPDEAIAAKNTESKFEQMTRAAWVYSGGSPSSPTLEIKLAYAQMSPVQRECFEFCSLPLTDTRPNPFMPSWLSFGFVVASCMGEEIALGRAYTDLIRKCTFSEVCSAYESCSIPALFERYNAGFGNWRRFCDVMAGPRGSHKSVWDLKLYVDQLASSRPEERPKPARSVARDYGYGNCKSGSERELLDGLYRQLFDEARGVDPLALHEACIKGALLDFVKAHVKLAPWTAKYRRLLKNAHPLPELSGLRSVSPCEL